MMFDQRCSVQHTHRSTRITTSSIIFNPKLVKKYRPDSCWYHFRLISYARTLIVQRIWSLSHNLEVFPCSYSWEERTDQVHRSNSSSKLLVVMGASVTAVSLSKAHTFSKANQYSIRLVTGEGVAGDAHCGKTNQHVPAKAMDPKPNLRQVHIIHSELHDELQSAGFNVAAGQMGENITTRGVDVVKLPLGTRLHIGSTAVLELTGLRSTCSNLNKIQSGLLNAVQPRDQKGNIIRKAGVMCIVVRGAEVRPGDPIQVELPAYPHQALPVL